jgi:hypothetical protein
MLESPRPCGASRSPEDPTVAMQRIIDQALDLVPPTGALTTQDEAALARLTRFVSTVAGAMWDLSGTDPGTLSAELIRMAGAWPTRPQLTSESYSHVAARAAMSSC